jgi:translation initiation factor 5
MFFFLQKCKTSKQIDDKEILTEAERLEVKDKAPLILANGLFDEDMLKQIPLYRKVFLRVSYLYVNLCQVLPACFLQLSVTQFTVHT